MNRLFANESNLVGTLIKSIKVTTSSEILLKFRFHFVVFTP
jgi:hypothetical protein